MAIDINRKTTGVLLPEVVSNEIWAKTLEESAVMNLANKIDIPGPGQKVQVITGEPTASVVAETDQKPVSKHTFNQKTMIPYMFEVTEPFSNQFRRDKSALYEECVRRAPAAIGKLFDQIVFAQPTYSVPGAGFDSFNTTDIGEESIQNDPYGGTVKAKKALAVKNYAANRIALSPAGEAHYELSRDNVGRPLYIQNINQDRVAGRINGLDVYLSNGLYIPEGAAGSGRKEQFGIIGDWNQCAWGSVGDINLSIADQATITIGGQAVNLWERNMFAVRFEVELGFVIKDKDAFLRLTGGTPALTAKKGK